MRKTRLYVLVFVLASLAVCGFINRAQAQNKAEKTSLSGLKGLHLVVEKIDPQLNTALLESVSVEKDIQATLAAAGIKIVDEDEMLKTAGMPYIYINVGTAKAGLVFAYHVQVEVRQGAYLERDPNIIVTSTTWSGRGVTGMVAISETNTIRTVLDDSVAEFIKAYIAANPTEKPN
ncbi:MAG: hypothetical protein A2Y07_02650 [Planctomycetes bacterium GWF2_50_10]|nr:MAG: hypothetical protein A2Y07_02650 [Planctomycetes bacterium GWF2_50_10]